MLKRRSGIEAWLPDAVLVANVMLAVWVLMNNNPVNYLSPKVLLTVAYHLMTGMALYYALKPKLVLDEPEKPKQEAAADPALVLQ